MPTLEMFDTHPIVGVRRERLAAEVARVERYVTRWRGGRCSWRIETGSSGSDASAEILDLVARPESFRGRAKGHVIPVFVNFLASVKAHTS